MKTFTIILALAAHVSSARLDHLQYLPPHTNSGQFNLPVRHNQSLDQIPTDPSTFGKNEQELKFNFGQEAPNRERLAQFEPDGENQQPIAPAEQNLENNAFSTGMPQSQFGNNQDQPALSFYSPIIFNGTSQQESNYYSTSLEKDEDFPPFLEPQNKNLQFEKPEENQDNLKQPNLKTISEFPSLERSSSSFFAPISQHVSSATPLSRFGVNPNQFSESGDSSKQHERDFNSFSPQIQESQLKTKTFAQNPFLKIEEYQFTHLLPNSSNFETSALKNVDSNGTFQFDKPNGIKNNLVSPSDFDNQDFIPSFSQPESSGENENHFKTPLNQFTFNPTQNQPLDRLKTETIPILRLVNTNRGDGTYQYAYQTANDITALEEGNARFDGTRAQGYYAYTSPEGKKIEVTYTADERGFLPQGDHIPTAPPVPKAILKALDYIRSVQEERILRGEVLDDGQYREHYNGDSKAASNNFSHNNMRNTNSDADENKLFGSNIGQQNLPQERQGFENRPGADDTFEDVSNFGKGIQDAKLQESNKKQNQFADQPNQNGPRKQIIVSKHDKPLNINQQNNNPVSDHQETNSDRFSLDQGSIDNLEPRGKDDLTHEGYRY